MHANPGASALLLTIALGLASAACTPSAQSGGASAAGGHGGATVVAGGAGGVAQGGAGGGATGGVAHGGAGGGEIPAGCTEATGLSISLTLPDGTEPGCSENPTLTDLTGIVVPSDAGVWLTIQTCPPDGACDPGLVRLTLGGGKVPAPGVPEGSFARIRLDSERSQPFGAECGSRAVLVTEVASFGGVTHPDAKGRTWLLATQSWSDSWTLRSTVADLPFTVTTMPREGCAPPPYNDKCPCPMTPNDASAWVFRFADPADAANEREVIMGQLVAGWAVGEQRFDLFNARGTFGCGCDELPLWQFWVAQSSAD